MIKNIFLITPIICIGMLTTGCKSDVQLKHFDEQQIDLIQFSKIEEGDDVAVIKTSKGDIYIRFFEQEVSELVREFKHIAVQGNYNNILIGADSQAEKNSSMEINHISTKPSKNRPYTLDKENISPSPNLIHIPGAVSASLNKDGDFTGEFFIIADRETPRTAIEDMESCRYPNNIVDEFEKRGGYPELWLIEPIFGQVYEGMDVVENIKKDISNGDEIEIISINIDEYRKNTGR